LNKEIRASSVPQQVRRHQLTIGSVLNYLAAALVMGDMLVLLVGVIMRYVFHQPLIWSDELASLLFIWLAVIGATMALRGGEHMAMTAIAKRTPVKVQHFLQAVGFWLCLGFLLAAIRPAFDYASGESMASILSLDISQGWHVYALPIGLIAMVAVIVPQVVLLPWRMVVLAALLVTAAGLVLWLIRPEFLGLGRLNLLVFFVGFVSAAVFAGVPIAFSFGLATFLYLSLSTHIPLSILVARMDTGMSHPVLLSIPLFVFLGLLIEMTGMAAAMVGFLANLIGHVRGGMSFVLIAAMYVVSGISGSKAADMAAIAPVLLPEMERRGATRGELVALLSATGAQTETIPPSLILITIGSVTGISISALFAGGMLPGLVVGLVLCCVVWHAAADTARQRRPSLKLLLRSFTVALPALALPFLIRGAVVEGVATATEVSTIGIVYAVLSGLLLHRQFDWRRIVPMLVRTATLSGAILLIVGTATAMAWAITQSGFSRVIAAWVAATPGGAPAFMAISILLFIVLGSVLEGIPAIVVFGPLLFPVARQIGINEVHYAMVAVLGMGVGLFSPPFGVGYYTACAIARCDPDEGIRYIGRYLIALLFGLIIVAAVPWISTVFL
jgi:tripartite ATP-independent transporter DctM subunit